MSNQHLRTVEEHQDRHQELKQIQETTPKNTWKLLSQKDFIYYFERF